MTSVANLPPSRDPDNAGARPDHRRDAFRVGQDDGGAGDPGGAGAAGAAGAGVQGRARLHRPGASRRGDGPAGAEPRHLAARRPCAGRDVPPRRGRGRPGDRRGGHGPLRRPGRARRGGLDRRPGAGVGPARRPGRRREGDRPLDRPPGARVRDVRRDGPRGGGGGQPGRLPPPSRRLPGAQPAGLGAVRRASRIPAPRRVAGDPLAAPGPDDLRRVRPRPGVLGQVGRRRRGGPGPRPPARAGPPARAAPDRDGPGPVARPGREEAGGAARDPAFCFYYEDNLDLLRASGAEIVPFSPLDDAGLPDRIDLLYLGGGYPEMFAARLASNAPMRAAIRDHHAAGGRSWPSAAA